MADQLGTQTKQVALTGLRLGELLNQSEAARIVGRQLGRAATSVGANCRAAQRAQSGADMLAKLKRVEEEADQVLYWIEIIEEGGLMASTKLVEFQGLAESVLRMTVASLQSVRQKLPKTSARKA